MDLFDHAFDRLLRRPHSEPSLARSRRVQPPKRVTQKIERLFRYPTQLCLVLVNRQLQLTHDPAHPHRCFIRLNTAHARTGRLDSFCELGCPIHRLVRRHFGSSSFSPLSTRGVSSPRSSTSNIFSYVSRGRIGSRRRDSSTTPSIN